MSTQKLIILPKLNNRKGDTAKQWYVFYSFRNPQTGKMEQKRVYAGFEKYKTESGKYRHARDLVAELTEKLKNGWIPIDDEKVVYEDVTQHESVAKKYSKIRRSNKNFTYYSSKFLNIKKNVIAKSSYQTYQSKFRVFIAWMQRKNLIDNDISAITEKVMLDFIDYLVHEHKNLKDKSRGISNQMVNKYINTIRTVFKMVEDERKGYVNPMRKIEYLKAQSTPSEVYTERMMRAVRDYTLEKDPQLWTIILFIYATFIRPGELRFLQVKNVDLFQGYVEVPAAIAKNRKRRRVQIPGYFSDYLAKMNLQQYPAESYLITTTKKPGKKPVGKNYMWNHFEKVRQHFNIPRNYKFYGFKHTGASDLDRAGVSLKTIQMQIDHHSLDMTDKYLQSLRKKRSDQIETLKPDWE